MWNLRWRFCIHLCYRAAVEVRTQMQSWVDNVSVNYGFSAWQNKQTNKQKQQQLWNKVGNSLPRQKNVEQCYTAFKITGKWKFQPGDFQQHCVHAAG